MVKRTRKSPPVEVKCEACGGTGLQPAKRPARPGRRIFPPPCKVCKGKGRLRAPIPD